MIRRKFTQKLTSLTTIGVTVAMAVLACSKVDTVPSGNSVPGAEVEACGNLDATAAAQLTVARLEHLGTVGLASLAGLENSRAAARLLSFGNSALIEPFVAEAQGDVQDSLLELKDRYLVASNVESASGASVTFLLRPESVCDPAPTDTGVVVAVGGASTSGGASTMAGTTSGLDPDCVNKQTENPTRVRISRIACDAGDNVAVEVLHGPSSERLLLGELYSERAELELNLGAYLRHMTVTSYSTSSAADGAITETRTTKPLVSAAVGTLHGSMMLNGTSQASGKVSVSEAIDFTMADESAVRVRLAAGADVATIAADGAMRTIRVTANLGAFDWRANFVDFINDFFGLDTTDSASAQAPVDLHVSGLLGEVSLDGNKDEITSTGLNLGSTPATAVQGGQTLLSIAATGSQNGPISATLSGNADNTLGIALPGGLSVVISYGLAKVQSYVVDPANFLAEDGLTVAATTGCTLSLLPNSGSESLAIADGQLGSLLRVDSGTVTLSSRLWPNDTASVGAAQCMVRSESTDAGRHDLLGGIVVGACVQ